MVSLFVDIATNLKRGTYNVRIYRLIACSTRAVIWSRLTLVCETIDLMTSPPSAVGLLSIYCKHHRFPRNVGLCLPSTRFKIKHELHPKKKLFSANQT